MEVPSITLLDITTYPFYNISYIFRRIFNKIKNFLILCVKCTVLKIPTTFLTDGTKCAIWGRDMGSKGEGKEEIKCDGNEMFKEYVSGRLENCVLR